MRLHDALVGCLLAILGIAVLISVSQYPAIPGQNVGPSAFPGTLALLLLVCSGLLIWRGLRDGRSQAIISFGAWIASPRHVLNVVAVVGGLLFYIFCADFIGFIPIGIIILSVLFFCLGVRPLLILPVALVATLVIHTIFYKLLRVPLPWGIMQGMIW
ncbi:tripartite tricarboxylate transporter TctB family protein [Ferrovibrio sp.]|uniref:tripartite tricarboxylate transporter TctB family protein n=1 Tax=Ferrovibrio sp. TaxID=1917215 RepID=UPI001B78749A|nr:tripartite tricarboxylate transporter TctB family protein [Ferrovibrio sp.]MBP7065228.1 tripartite tricarboxylate transporter TctB family protein [Ferrovibrio sp.]